LSTHLDLAARYSPEFTKPMIIPVTFKHFSMILIKKAA
jgi:hypothetical protein